MNWNTEYVRNASIKERVTTGDGLAIIELNYIKVIQDSHSHSPDVFDMLKGYNQIKDRANENTEESIRPIFANGDATFGDSSLIRLSRTDSIKNETFASTRKVLKLSVTQQTLLKSCSSSNTRSLQKVNFFYNFSGVGDSNPIIVFATPKMLSILKTPKQYVSRCILKTHPKGSMNCTITRGKVGYIFLCVNILVTEKKGADLQQDVSESC